MATKSFRIFLLCQLHRFRKIYLINLLLRRVQILILRTALISGSLKRYWFYETIRWTFYILKISLRFCSINPEFLYESFLWNVNILMYKPLCIVFKFWKNPKEMFKFYKRYHTGYLLLYLKFIKLFGFWIVIIQ